jgi:hypothetical protein
MIIWTLTSAEQCTNTDACGAHTSNAFTDKIKLTLVTNIPQGYGRPITQFVVPYINPLININAGFTSTIPRTIFNIKVESYELCADQTPRYRTLCCRTFDQTCSLTNTETTFELPIIWDAYFKK